MSFVQTIKVHTKNETALAEHLAAWHAQQCGIAPGYRGARLLADCDRPDEFTIVAAFESEEEAAVNNGRPETLAWAEGLRKIASGEVRFIDQRIVLETLPRH
jgi:quinol monooxygenase YgiN